MAAKEATCLRLAAACGLLAPEAELLDAAGLPDVIRNFGDPRDVTHRIPPPGNRSRG